MSHTNAGMRAGQLPIDEQAACFRQVLRRNRTLTEVLTRGARGRLSSPVPGRKLLEAEVGADFPVQVLVVGEPDGELHRRKCLDVEGPGERRVLARVE